MFPMIILNFSVQFMGFTSEMIVWRVWPELVRLGSADLLFEQKVLESRLEF
jgi:hypothetical protein